MKRFIAIIILIICSMLFSQDRTIPEKIENFSAQKGQHIAEMERLQILIYNIDGAIWAYTDVLSDTVKTDTTEADSVE